MGRARRESAPSLEVERRDPTTNHYAVMGIHDFARGSEAKRAYHRLALEWHPDRQVHASEHRQKEAEDVFKRINEAYAILSDNVRRKEFDLVLRNELLGRVGGNTGKKSGAKDASNRSSHAHEANKNSSEGGGGTRLLLCPECGEGAEVKAGKKGGPSLQCRGCSAFFHEVYCAGCKDWGATRGRRGESTMRCGCGNVFCQSRCPSCWRWNTFNGEAQGGRTRSCGFCGCKFHEAFCPGCSSWGVWEGKKGCRSLSCDCGGLFYEISCQSCGMWGSVKGRHADANNSLRCGTCGSESHEAFCPTCRRWDSYPGSKGESTLTCKSARCRGGRTEAKTAAEAAATKFFQVYCETCVCWRSVLGEKDAVGKASVRCEGCKSNLRGTACPACGNWDQLLGRPHQHQRQRFRRKARLHENQPRSDGSDPSAADAREDEGGSSLSLVRPPPMCTSCGHQPPKPAGDDESLEDAASTCRTSLTGVVHEQAKAAAPSTASAAHTAPPIAAGAPPVAAGAPPLVNSGATVVGLAQTGETRTPPPVDVDEAPVLGDSKAAPVAVQYTGGSPPIPAGQYTEQRAEEGGEAGRGGGEEKKAIPCKAFASAPIHGMNTTPHADSRDVAGPQQREQLSGGGSQAEDLASSGARLEKNRRHRKHQAGGGASTSSFGSTVAADDASAEEEGARPVFQPLLPEPGAPPHLDAEDSRIPVPVTPVMLEENAVTRAVLPPPRSILRRRGGRRPFVPRHPSPSSPSVGEGAEAELAGADAGTTSEIEAAANGEKGRRENRVARAAVLLTPSTTEGADASSTTLAENNLSARTAASRQRTESDRPASRNRGAGVRRRQKRLSSRSSSSSPSPRPLSSNPPPATPPSTAILAGENRTSVGDGHPTIPAPATFAAVPRESSPPPPPGMRIGGEEGAGETHGPGRRTGIKEVVHLAFCSRCQEYQSWRAPLRSAGRRSRRETASSGGDGGGSGSRGARRTCCTECGDSFCSVSYYPAR